MQSNMAASAGNNSRRSPQHMYIAAAAILKKVKESGGSLLVLTGAGMSVMSGVPVFRNSDGQTILGAIGQLQFDTFQYRLEDEYGAISRLDPMPYETSRWFNAKDKNKFSTYEAIIHDMEGRAVVLFRSKHRLKSFKQNNTEVKLSEYPLD